MKKISEKKKVNIWVISKKMLNMEVKNRKIHLTSTKIDEIIFCLQDFENYPISDILEKKRKKKIFMFMDFGDQFDEKSKKITRNCVYIGQ